MEWLYKAHISFGVFHGSHLIRQLEESQEDLCRGEGQLKCKQKEFNGLL